MSVLLKAAYFIALLGGLVFFHELGHFIVAKLCKVKVLKFSLGFGPRIWGFKRGETDYQLAALPLGGFVLMLGADPSATIPPEDKGRAYSDQPPLRRILISVAGPAANILLALLVTFGMNLTPQPQEPAVVTIVVPDEAADLAGIQPRDKIRTIDGTPVRSFQEMRDLIEARPGKNIEVVVERAGELRTVRLTPSVVKDRSSPIETVSHGRIGVQSGNLLSFIAVVPNSRAAKAGLRTFDQVVSINGKKLSHVLEVNDELKALGDNSELRFEVIRSAPVDLKTSSISTSQVLPVTVPAGPEPLGLDSPDLYVQEVDPDGPAGLAGLRPLDKIVAVGGAPIRSSMRLAALMDEHKTIDLQVDRGGELVKVSFSPAEKTRRHWLLGKETRVEDGFVLKSPIVDPVAPADRITVTYSAGEAFWRAGEHVVEMMRGVVLGIGAIFAGRVSPRSMGSVIMIGQLSGIISEQGLMSYLAFFAYLSVNIGLMNLLPLPILDGFNIVLATVEGISRRAVPLRVQEFAMRVGVILLVALMAMALTSDIARVVGL